LLISKCGHLLLGSCPDSFLQAPVARAAAAQPVPVKAPVSGGGHKGSHYLLPRAGTAPQNRALPHLPHQKAGRQPLHFAFRPCLFTHEELQKASGVLAECPPPPPPQVAPRRGRVSRSGSFVIQSSLPTA